MNGSLNGLLTSFAGIVLFRGSVMVGICLALLSAVHVVHAQEPEPQTGLHYFVVVSLDAEGEPAVRRGITGSNGIAYDNLILAPNTRYRHTILQAETFWIASDEFTTPSAGQTLHLPPVVLRKPKSTDSDSDGLHDEGEFVVGTSPSNPDTDEDGILDGAEVRQGTNPLDNKPVRTGIIAAADTPGTAVDICALNDIAAVADSEAGVSVLNVANGTNPTIIAQVGTPGTAQAVACTGNLIAVADGTAGLAIIDISDPPAARITHQVDLRGVTQALTLAANVAYVGTSEGQLAVVDLISGVVMEQTFVEGAVHDVAIEGDTLFVLLDGRLRAYGLAQGFLEFLGDTATTNISADSITTRKRLFVGGGYAYVSTHVGYETLDVSDPGTMQIVGQAHDQGQNSFKQLVTNGSGLGVATVGIDPVNDDRHHVWLYDASDPIVTTNALIDQTVRTPGLARAVSIFNGLAYVADGEAGMEIINYRAYDSQGIPPTIELSTNFPRDVAEEGQIFRVTASVSDDVQVRNVEFYVDGEIAATDGNFPFEHRFTAPRLADQPSFTLWAKATDTGGNSTLTDEIVVTVTPDKTPPRITRVTPQPGRVFAPDIINVLSATFNEPVDSATLNRSSFQLFSAGPDGETGNEDDVPIMGGVFSYREEIKTLFLDFAAPLPPDRYWAMLPPGIADLAGNLSDAESEFTFRIFLADLVAGRSFVGAGNIDVPRAQDIYTFTAEPGQAVYFDAQSGNPCLPIRWKMVDPDGVEVFNQSFGQPAFNCPSGEPGRLMLKQGGTYKLTVYANGDGTGLYQFQIYEPSEGS